jgi:hypothetical protein
VQARQKKGKVAGYDLAQGFIEGLLAQSRYVPLKVARTVEPAMPMVEADTLEIDQKET